MNLQEGKYYIVNGELYVAKRKGTAQPYQPYVPPVIPIPQVCGLLITETRISHTATATYLSIKFTSQSPAIYPLVGTVRLGDSTGEIIGSSTRLTAGEMVIQLPVYRVDTPAHLTLESLSTAWLVTRCVVTRSITIEAYQDPTASSSPPPVIRPVYVTGDLWRETTPSSSLPPSPTYVTGDLWLEQVIPSSAPPSSAPPSGYEVVGWDESTDPSKIDLEIIEVTPDGFKVRNRVNPGGYWYFEGEGEDGPPAVTSLDGILFELDYPHYIEWFETIANGKIDAVPKAAMVIGVFTL